MRGRDAVRGREALSTDRAEAVKQALVKKYNFDPNKFIVEGKGWDEPANPDDPMNQALTGAWRSRSTAGSQVTTGAPAGGSLPRGGSRRPPSTPVSSRSRGAARVAALAPRPRPVSSSSSLGRRHVRRGGGAGDLATILPSPAEVVASFPLLWFDRALTRNLAVSFVRWSRASSRPRGVVPPRPAHGLVHEGEGRVHAAHDLRAYLPIPPSCPSPSRSSAPPSCRRWCSSPSPSRSTSSPVRGRGGRGRRHLPEDGLHAGGDQGPDGEPGAAAHLVAEIWQAMRMGFGVGWSYILLAEMVDVGRGIGGIIITSQRRAPRAHLPGAGDHRVVAFLTDKLWAAVGRWLFPYRAAKR